jgi:hypothetical protein
VRNRNVVLFTRTRLSPRAQPSASNPLATARWFGVAAIDGNCVPFATSDTYTRVAS